MNPGVIKGPKSPLICAYNVFETLKERYPKRILQPDAHCNHNEFYYFSTDGSVRLVDTKDWSIWVCDYVKGPFHMKRIR